MERVEFVRILVDEYHKCEDDFDFLNDQYKNRDISKTEIVRILSVKESTYELHKMLKNEYVKDNWENLKVELVNEVLQLMSLSIIGEMFPLELHGRAGDLYYWFIEKLFDITMKDNIFFEDVHKLYLNHMKNIKVFLIRVKEIS